ncbi:MAG: ABC transporter permease [Mollicutes bacterium]|nr:ABC transporter permease [Mollicutes bacterium]
MNNRILITIKKELRGIIRDKKSLMMMLVTPILIPIFILLFSYMYETMLDKDESTNTYNIGVNYTYTKEEKKSLKELNLNIKQYKSKNELQDSYKKGKIDLYVIKSNNNYKIYENESNQNSIYATSIYTKYLDSINKYLGDTYLDSINASKDKVYNNITYEYKKLEGKNDFVNQVISTGLMFVVMAITLTSIYSATDATAGEKERGTLETLLTFPIKKEELLTGKYLAITISCIITTILSLILTVISLKISSNIFSFYKDAVININMTTLLLALIIMISYSFFISGACIAIASFSKTFKEAQSALTPLSFTVMIPMFLEILDIKLNSCLSLIPVISHTMLLEQVICNTLTTTTIINIFLMFTSTILITIIIIKIITKVYKSEKILFSL